NMKLYNPERGMTFDKNGLAFGIFRESGTLSRAVVAFLGRLLLGLVVLVGRKAVLEGGPRTMELAQWLISQTAVVLQKSCKEVKPQVKGVGKILKALLIISGRKLKMEAGPKIMETGQLIRRECTALVIKSIAKRRGQSAKGVKKPQSTSNDEPMEEDINSAGLLAERSVEQNKGQNMFGDYHYE
ncbi:MAG: hypothetical protein WAM88_08580, partial [Nitrososphaeraceae archaeon]